MPACLEVAFDGEQQFAGGGEFTLFAGDEAFEATGNADRVWRHCATSGRTSVDWETWVRDQESLGVFQAIQILLVFE